MASLLARLMLSDEMSSKLSTIAEQGQQMVSLITDAFMEASAAAAEFEVAVMKIATIADTSKVSIAQISSDIMDLSMETGNSVNELSEAVYSAISASVDTASAVEFTGTATKLAAGGFTSSATAVDVLTTALNAYGLEAGEAENISDMLITTQNLGKTTVDELAASVGKVIPIASAYGVEMDNLSAAYAELTKGGIATAEAGTYLKAMLNELGDSGSDVSAVLMEQTGSSFAQLTEQGYSLGDVMAVLGDSVDGNAGAFNELWSSSEAGVGALALYNAGATQFNTTLNETRASAGATQSAFDTMNNTVTHAQEKMINAAHNLQISVGQSINPLIRSFYELGAGALDAATNFTRAYPVVTKVLAAAVVGLGAVTTAVSVYTVVTTKAIPVIVEFGTAVNSALGPVGLAVAAISALTVAGAALAVMMQDETVPSVADVTEAASGLESALDDASASYENTVDSTLAAANVADVYINKLEQMGDYASLSEEEQKQYHNTLTLLCQTVPELASCIDLETNSIEGGTSALKSNTSAWKEAAQARAGQELLDEATAAYSDVLMEQEKNVINLTRAQAELEAAEKAYNDTLQRANELAAEASKNGEELPLEYYELSDSLSELKDRMTNAEYECETFEEAIAEDQEAAAEAEAEITELQEAIGNLGDSSEDIDPLAPALNAVAEEVTNLVAEYDAAYDAALESFQGQFGLFDEAQADMNATVANAQAALDSQLAYWQSYGENVALLKSMSADDLNLTQENYDLLMSYVQSGSEEAAGLAASMVANINSGNEEAITNLANTAGEIAAAQQQVASDTAAWQTDFDARMTEIVNTMNQTVADLNLSGEAQASAEATMSGYTAGIQQGGSAAVAAARSIANQVKAALSAASTNINIGVSSSTQANAKGTTNAASVFLAGEKGPELVARKTAAYAVGTTNSDDYFIAGENGPELIVGEQGSTVFPTEETDRLLGALNDRPQSILPVLSSEGGERSESLSQEQTKRIIIEIAGGGSIEITGNNYNEDEAAAWLADNLRPMLIRTLKQEMFEEGVGSREY